MKCLSCDGAVDESLYGDWCRTCCGQMRGKDLFVRRGVAVFTNAGKEQWIVYDTSIAEYSISYKRQEKRFLEEKGEWIQQERTLAQCGSLDRMIVAATTETAGDVAPTMVIAPTATDDERQILNLDLNA